MPKGQEDQEAQEPKWDVFVDKFNSLGMESLLRLFEIKEREKISNSPLNVRDSFDKKWGELTGKPYYQAITTVQQVMAPFDGRNDTRRSDPRSLNYREPITFTKLFWQKIRRKRGKKMHDFFIIEGLTGAGARRPLFGGISVERLFMVFGDNIASMIVADAKKEGRGELKENIEIPVEGYWEVQFAPQKDINEEKDVRLTVEGVCLRMLRMVPVIMPGFYIEAADNTTKPIYTHESGKGRQKVGSVQKYPYTVLRQSEMEEYLVQKAKGDKEQREHERREEEAV